MIVLDVIIILTIMGGNISMATDEKFAKEGLTFDDVLLIPAESEDVYKRQGKKGEGQCAQKICA